MVRDKLSAFLAESAGKPYRLGEWDCGLWLADWYMVATGNPDPVADIRLRDGSKLNDLGGATRIKLFTKRVGLQRTSEPKRGDIGLVSIQKGHLVGAIFTGSNWCVLVDDHGIGAIRPERLRFVAAWEIPSCPPR